MRNFTLSSPSDELPAFSHVMIIRFLFEGRTFDEALDELSEFGFNNAQIQKIRKLLDQSIGAMIVEDQKSLKAYKIQFNVKALIGLQINQQTPDYDYIMRVKQKFISLLAKHNSVKPDLKLSLY